MTILRELGAALRPVIDLVYPPRCPLCGAAIGDQNGLCPACWGEMTFPGEPACATCQRPFAAPPAADAAMCGPCLANPPNHDGIVAGTYYDASSRKLVLAFKHGGKIALAGLLAWMIAARMPAVDEGWLVVPVPLHRRRLWQRGYNQAALLAREIARLKGASLAVDGLIRTKATPSLGGLGRTARARALSGAIVVNDSRAAILRGAKVMLVDDVLTSGATSDACVRALKQAGARTVIIGCFARVMDAP